VYIYDLPSGTVQIFNVAGVSAADFSIDSFKAMLVSGNALYVYTGTTSLAQFPLAAPASDIKFSSQSSIAMAAEGSGEMLANCSNLALVQTPGTVGTLLAKTSVADRMWGADGNNLYQLDFTGNYATTSSTDCRPQVSAASTARSLGASVTPVQLVATPNGQRAYLVNNSTTLYSASTSAVIPISLTGGGQPLAAAASPDGTNLFVGSSSGDVHRIDVSSSLDVQQIAVSLKKADGSAIAPSLIGVRTK
jgi:hypothetical protein